MLRDREQQGSVQRFGQHLIQIQERALELARVTGNLAWRVWESVVMRIESTRFCFGIRSDICIDHLLTLRCEKIDCEDKALEVVSFLWPFRCRLALPIHGGQDVNTKGVDAWLKFEWYSNLPPPPGCSGYSIARSLLTTGLYWARSRQALLSQRVRRSQR